jgi:DNA mismatch endonuclease, patch repair protein
MQAPNVKVGAESSVQSQDRRREIVVDRYSRTKRSEIMSRVRSTDTKPELRVRSFLHRLGYRFRLHCRDLPGRPDIVLPRYRAAIFVHGCFWHQHQGCSKARLPETSKVKWAAKLSRNADRDQESKEALQEAGWIVATVWECELKDYQLVGLSLSHVLPDLAERVTAKNKSAVLGASIANYQDTLERKPKPLASK